MALNVSTFIANFKVTWNLLETLICTEISNKFATCFKFLEAMLCEEKFLVANTNRSPHQAAVAEGTRCGDVVSHLRALVLLERCPVHVLWSVGGSTPWNWMLTLTAIRSDCDCATRPWWPSDQMRKLQGWSSLVVTCSEFVCELISRRHTLAVLAWGRGHKVSWVTVWLNLWCLLLARILFHLENKPH